MWITYKYGFFDSLRISSAIGIVFVVGWIVTTILQMGVLSYVLTRLFE